MVSKKALFVLLVLLPGYIFAQTGERIHEPGGNFSYQAPLNWTVMEFPGLPYRVVIGPVEGEFASNILFLTEEYPGDLRSYVDLNIANFGLFFTDFSLLDRSAFQTTSGLAGEKVVIRNNTNGVLLRQVFYIFPAPNSSYFVITCSSLESSAGEYMPLFDQTMRTFQLGPN